MYEFFMEKDPENDTERIRCALQKVYDKNPEAFVKIANLMTSRRALSTREKDIGFRTNATDLRALIREPVKNKNYEDDDEEDPNPENNTE